MQAERATTSVLPLCLSASSLLRSSTSSSFSTFSLAQVGPICPAPQINQRKQRERGPRVPFRTLSGQPSLPDVFELTEQNLSVVAKSAKAIVIDCYADWCEPCKKLGPILQKVCAEFSPHVSLALMNVDKFEKLSQQLQVKSLPAVIAIKGGRAMGRFEGLQNEAYIREFVSSLVKAGDEADPAAPAAEKGETPDSKLEKAQKLFEANKANKKEMDDVTEKFAELLANPDSSKKVRAMASAGLVRCALVVGQTDTAKSLHSMLLADAKNDPELKDALLESWCRVAGAEVSFADDFALIGTKTVAELRKECEKAPKDPQAAYNLAIRLFCEGDVKDGFLTVCKVIAIDRHWKDGAGKALANRMIDAMAEDAATVGWARRRLTNALL